MWIDVKTESDVEEYLKATQICDDYSYRLVSVEFKTFKNQYSADSCGLLLILENEAVGRLEMFFQNVIHFSFSGQNDCNIGKADRCELEIRTDLLGKTRNDRLILWTDGCKVLHRNGVFDASQDNSKIIAYNLKYRIIKNEE